MEPTHPSMLVTGYNYLHKLLTIYKEMEPTFNNKIDFYTTTTKDEKEYLDLFDTEEIEENDKIVEIHCEQEMDVYNFHTFSFKPMTVTGEFHLEFV